MTDLITPAELAAELRIPLDTLAAWRHRGNGPKYLKIGKHVRYERDAITKYLATVRN